MENVALDSLSHLEGRVAYFAHLSTVVQRNWMHRTFLHRQRLDHGWFNDSIINRPKIPNRRSLCKCGVCAMAKAKLRQNMLDKNVPLDAMKLITTLGNFSTTHDYDKRTKKMILKIRQMEKNLLTKG